LYGARQETSPDKTSNIFFFTRAQFRPSALYFRTPLTTRHASDDRRQFACVASNRIRGQAPKQSVTT
jgi:hypothetical protein